MSTPPPVDPGRLDPPPGRPAGGATGFTATSRHAAGWVLHLLLWGAAIAAGAVAGGPLALFGLSGVALAAAFGLVALGAFGWRRAALPLSLTAAALAISATAIATQPTRVQRSHGLLIAAPRTPAQASETVFRRGHGSVVVDLRSFTAPAGSTTTIRARSDDGGIVVALPRERCFRLSVTYGSVPLPTEGIRGLALAGLLVSGVVPGSHENISGENPYRTPDSADPSGNGANLVAFGRSERSPSLGPSSTSQYRWTRPLAGAQVPTLDLRLVAPGTIVVRDYPKGVSPAFDRFASEPWNGDDVGDRSWPDGLRLPPSPADLSWADRWREHPTSVVARRQARVWQRWYRRFVPAAQAQAQRAAGSCADRVTRGSYWVSKWFGGYSGDRASERWPGRAIAVNGNGAVRSYVQRFDASAPTPATNPITTPTANHLGAEETR